MCPLGDERVFVPKTEFARALRKQWTRSELALWDQLKGSKIGFKVTRQFPIGRPFADFCCRSHRVVVEIDGASHENKREDDEIRDEYFRQEGYIVLRFESHDVLDHPVEVAETIKMICTERPQWRY